MAHSVSSPSSTWQGGSLYQGGVIWLAPAVGRVLLSAIFLLSGTMKFMNWEMNAQYMESQGMIYIPFLLASAALIEIIAGLALFLGWWARFAALGLVLFMIPTTLIFHDFWSHVGQEQQTQMIHFLKNLAIMGGLFQVMGFGAGPVSLDWKLRSPGPALPR